MSAGSGEKSWRRLFSVDFFLFFMVLLLVIVGAFTISLIQFQSRIIEARNQNAAFTLNSIAPIARIQTLAEEATRAAHEMRPEYEATRTTMDAIRLQASFVAGYICENVFRNYNSDQHIEKYRTALERFNDKKYYDYRYNFRSGDVIESIIQDCNVRLTDNINSNVESWLYVRDLSIINISSTYGYNNNAHYFHVFSETNTMIMGLIDSFFKSYGIDLTNDDVGNRFIVHGLSGLVVEAGQGGRVGAIDWALKSRCAVIHNLRDRITTVLGALPPQPTRQQNSSNTTPDSPAPIQQNSPGLSRESTNLARPVFESTLDSLDHAAVTYCVFKSSKGSSVSPSQSITNNIKQINDEIKNILQNTISNFQAVSNVSSILISDIISYYQFYERLIPGAIQSIVQMPIDFSFAMLTVFGGLLGSMMRIIAVRSGVVNEEAEGGARTSSALMLAQGLLCALVFYILSRTTFVALTDRGHGAQVANLSPFVIGFVAVAAGLVAREAYAAITNVARGLFTRDRALDKKFDAVIARLEQPPSKDGKPPRKAVFPSDYGPAT